MTAFPESIDLATKHFAGIDRKKVALLGDSRLGGTTRTNGRQTHHSGFGMALWADMLLGGRLGFQHEDNFAINGGTTVHSLNNVDGIISNGSYWACIYSCGTNDPKPHCGPVPLPESLAAMSATWDRLRTAGIRLFIVQDIPREGWVWTRAGLLVSAIPDALTQLADMRDFAAAYAAAHPDMVHLVDPSPDILHAETGEVRAGIHHDGTHPSVHGAFVLGRVLADRIAPFLDPIPLDDVQGTPEPYHPVSHPRGNLLPNAALTLPAGPADTVPPHAAMPPDWRFCMAGAVPADSVVLSCRPSTMGMGWEFGMVGSEIRSAASSVIGIETTMSVPAGIAGRAVEGRVVARVGQGPQGLRAVTAHAMFQRDGEVTFLGNAFEGGEARYWPDAASHELALRTPAIRLPAAVEGLQLRMQLLVRIDGAGQQGAAFDVTFCKPSLRVMD